MSQRHDVIVIGSGIGGLTAALSCARKGRDVLVLEAAKEFGGFINPFKRKAFSFDAGIHYIGECAPGQQLYEKFSRLELDLQYRELSPDGFDRYVFPDYEVSMPKGAGAFLARLEKDFPLERNGLRSFFELIEKTTEAFAWAAKIRGIRSAARLLPHIPTLVRYHRMTYTQLLDRFFTDRRLKAVLSAPSGDLGLPPGRVAGILMLALFGHYLGGAYYPVGGQRSVRNAYLRELKKHGATLKRNSPVAEILVESGSAVGVRTQKGEIYRADAVISNADAAVTFGKLLPASAVPGRLRRKVERTVPSIGSLCVFLGLDPELQPQEHGLSDANIWSYPSYDIDSLYAPVLAGELAENLPFFMTIPTLKDPRGGHAPAGQHTVELITFAPWKPFERWQDQKTLKRDADYVALKNRLADNLIGRAERHLPNLSQHIEVREVATPLTNVSYVNTPAGSIYGPEHTPSQVGLGRFQTRTPVDRLFLCGASVFGCGIATCVASGSAAARAALAARRPLRRRIRDLRGSLPRLAQSWR